MYLFRVMCVILVLILYTLPSCTIHTFVTLYIGKPIQHTLATALVESAAALTS